MAKNLLNESQIRQFMKLSNLTPLAPGFVNGLKETHGRGLNDQGYGQDQSSPGRRVKVSEAFGEEEEELDATEDELGAEDDFADEEADELDSDMPDEMEMDVAADVGGDSRMVSVDDFLSALETALESAMGEEVEIDADEVDQEEEIDAEVDADADMDMGVELEDDEDEELLEVTHTFGTDGKSKERIAKDAQKKKDAEERKKYGTKGEYPKMTSKRPKGTAPSAHTAGRIGEGQDELIERVTKRVAARILKSALRKK